MVNFQKTLNFAFGYPISFEDMVTKKNEIKFTKVSQLAVIELFSKFRENYRNALFTKLGIE